MKNNKKNIGNKSGSQLELALISSSAPQNLHPKDRINHGGGTKHQTKVIPVDLRSNIYRSILSRKME